MEKLELLLADGIIEGVLGRLKSGKEADLWLVQHSGQVVAAKIYRDRDIRSFKNNADYKEGRQVGNSRTARAVARGSKFGRQADEQAWKSAEADSLHTLFAHGVRTPAPVLFYEGVLLMELVLDGQGQPAPRLIDTAVTAEQAGAFYRDLRSQVVKMLDADVIHGDLSPYNVLMGAAGPTIIDFPQVIAAAHNSRAESFFHRDLENLRRFFADFDHSLHGCAGDAREIWRAYVRRELSPDFVPTGHAPPAPHHHDRHPQQRGQQRPHQQQRQQQRPPQQQQQRSPQQQQQQRSPQQQQQRSPQQQQQRSPQQQQQQRSPQQQQQRPPQQEQPHHQAQRQQLQRHPPQGSPRPDEAARPPQGQRSQNPPRGPVVERVARLAGPTTPQPQSRQGSPGSQNKQPSQGQPSQPGHRHRHRWRR